MPEDITEAEIRKRRALYRANHRGIKEMDLLLGRYAEHKLPEMSDVELDMFEELLSVADRELEGWIMRGEYGESGEFAPLIASIRTFHNVG